MLKKETVKQRWHRWDLLIIEKKYIELIKEFDSMLKEKGSLKIGDLARRDDTLELMGVIPLSREKAKKYETRNKHKNY